jgi:hypothetical protein
VKFPLLLLAFASLGHADDAATITRTIHATGIGTVRYGRNCSGRDYDDARAAGVVGAVENALLQCGGNVKQLTPFVETDGCQDINGGFFRQEADFGCLSRANNEPNTLVSAAYFANVTDARDILRYAYNPLGEAATDKAANQRCGEKFVRVGPYNVTTIVHPNGGELRQLEVVTTTEVLCGAEPELL